MVAVSNRSLSLCGRCCLGCRHTVGDEYGGVASEALCRAARQACKLSLMVVVGLECDVEVVLVGEFQHRGVISEHRRALRDGVAAAIHRLSDDDVDVVP